MMQIFTHTPIWVWALLAFLVQRGIAMSQDRQISLRKACLLPVIMLAWSYYGVAQLGQAVLLVVSLFVTLGAAALRMKLAGQNQQSYDVKTDLLTIKGSWLPLVVILSIFVAKYGYNIAVAMAPALLQNTGFIWTSQLLFASVSGFFLANLVQSLMALNQAKTQQAIQAAGIA